MPAARLEVERLAAGYGSVSILSDIGFVVPAGGRLTVLGRNGVGKTTLLATLMGLTTHKGGSVRVGERDVTGLKTFARAAAGLGYVPQTRDVFRSLTVEENLFTGLKGRPRTELDSVYAMFPRLAERRNHGGMQLSGGEQQMLSLARTLLGKPQVLLLDEPLEGLAPVICDQLMETIVKLAQSGEMTVVLVEQQIERALDFADDVMVIERGRIVWQGQGAQLRGDRELVDSLLGVGIG
ncbi:ABC transporter ATP-binding protein [Rhodopseudomonas sp. HC1]|uniref:ABC transporter ATP-binding protein n=1 Tax=Rhodopseudomonas infernalis TaxID=2897386 RepID=UPI001EE92E09|nr:ABC transporter ATP-binding protein [Rhodopseudomonas infernalis]MCG6206718.1 ABC transporter ATP-binding protein [Rhodopseudomonas infernalis]